MTFEGAPCAGGASDTKPEDENFAIITNGNNRFDGNTIVFVSRVGRLASFGDMTSPTGTDSGRKASSRTAA